MSFHFRIALVCLLLVMAGCNSDPGPKATIEKVVAASGTLTYKGEPLESFQVTFMPTDGRRPATGITDKAGKFTLGTNGAADGAPPGSHKVAVTWIDPASANATGQELIIDNPAQMPKPKVKIPAKFNNPDTSGLTQEVPAAGATDLKIDLRD